jgi:hypothetical protein
VPSSLALRVSPNICRVTPKAASRDFVQTDTWRCNRSGAALLRCGVASPCAQVLADGPCPAHVAPRCRLTPSPQAERVTPCAFHASVLSTKSMSIRRVYVLHSSGAEPRPVGISPFELGARRRPQWRRVRRWRFVPFFRRWECFVWVPCQRCISGRIVRSGSWCVAPRAR